MRQYGFRDRFKALVATALALVVAAALLQDRPATATSDNCPGGIKQADLTLVSVTEDGVPTSGHYDARVVLDSRGPGQLELRVTPKNSALVFWSETYRAAPAAAP